MFPPLLTNVYTRPGDQKRASNIRAPLATSIAIIEDIPSASTTHLDDHVSKPNGFQIGPWATSATQRL